MSPLGITLLLAAGFAAFAVLAWRKLAIVVALAPDKRFDAPLARLKRLVTLGFGQARLLSGDRRPGLMHAVIFFGFLTLLLRKLHLIVIGYAPLATIPGAVGGLYTSFKDFVEVAVLVAVAYGFWRRFVRRPARLEPNREAVVILTLIALIMVTDFGFDAFRFARLAPTVPAIAHEAAWAWIGRPLSASLAGMSPQELDAGMHAFYWVQMATVFSFLAILPVGEHFHIVTSLPTVYFGRDAPLNRVPSVDLAPLAEDDADPDKLKIGARTALDLTWKEGLDAFTCTECGRCKDACPTFLTGKPLALKWVNDSVKHHLLEHADPIRAHDAPRLPALVGGTIGEETLWACTTCGYCEVACPIGLEHLPKFYRLRQRQVMMEGVFPHELDRVFAAYESQGNPWGLDSATRGDWAKDLGLPVVSTAEEVAALDYLFYVGSASSFDPRGQKIAKAFIRVAQAAGVRLGILGPLEGSTGECVRRLGNEMVFQQLATALVETLNGLGAQRIVTCDPHAFNALKNELPEFGGHYEVLHHSQAIDAWIAKGRLKVAPAHQRVIYHEPCYLGRHNREYEAPRRVLQAISRDAPLEFELARDKAMCCGAGGGRMWLEETIGKRINVLRAEQALAEQPKAVATACPYCAVMVGDGLAQLDDRVPARDLAELVAEALV
ncbi:MAG TPA: (Fe-S)-binding protein [Burkholderiaceae bacterium]|nr:(Fe-S)-binding protein [Burkholderiaceae bacterium]